MARSIDTIQNELIANVQAEPELASLTSTSKRAIWRLWTFVIAVSINILEQLMDVFKTNTDTTVSLAPPQTGPWFQDRIFKFQYDATTPQIIQLINLVPQYPTINADLRIITRASVKTSLAGLVAIKAAKGDPPEALSVDELAALQSYIALIGVTGISYMVTSADPDKLYIKAEIYYEGGFSSIISATVIASINNYLASLPFDGSLKLTDLESAIRTTPGVNDVIFNDVKARANSTSFAAGTFLVTGNQYVGRLWPTVAGYIVGETESGKTFADSLNFIAE